MKRLAYVEAIVISGGSYTLETKGIWLYLARQSTDGLANKLLKGYVANEMKVET